MADLTKQVCFIETEVLNINNHDPDSALFFEGRYNSDASNYWVPGVRCLMSIARTAGFKNVELIDYWEPPFKVTREGYLAGARGIFRATKGSPLDAPRMIVKN